MIDQERLQKVRDIASRIVLIALELKGQEGGTQTFIAALALACGGFIGEMATPEGLEDVLKSFIKDVTNLAASASEAQTARAEQDGATIQ